MNHPNELDQQLDNLRTLQQSYDQLAADVQAIRDAHILGFSYDGIVFAQGFEPQSAFGIIANRNRIVEIVDDRDSVLPNMLVTDYPLLEVFEMTEAINLISNWMRDSITLKSITLKNCSESPSGGLVNFIQGMPNLVHLDMQYSTATTTRYGQLSSCPKLIDVVFGSSLVANNTWLEEWNPTVALEDTDNSLVTDEEDEFGNTITNNKQQLLYNIRRHIAANLRTDVGNHTIKFSANVKAAIQADADTMAAFPSNWTIA